MTRPDAVVICAVLSTCVCISVLFFWTVWQQILISDLRDGTSTTTATTTTAAPATTAPAPTVAAIGGLRGDFHQGLVMVRQQVIDPLVEQQQQPLRKRDDPRPAPRVNFVHAKPKEAPMPPKPIFKKQVQPEKVAPVPELIDENSVAVAEQPQEEAAVPVERTEEDRNNRASLAMAANEAKFKAAAARAAKIAADPAAVVVDKKAALATNSKKVATQQRPSSLQERMRERARV